MNYLPSKGEILAALPAVDGKKILIKDDQGVRDIMREVIAAHEVYSPQYKTIAEYFRGGTPTQVAARLYDFCKRNIKYDVEGLNFQTTRAPQALLAMGRGDCKHYASFIGGILDALGGIDWRYCFASYDIMNSTPGHVFVVLKDQGKDVWVDPVLSGFDVRSPWPVFKKYKKPMALYRLSGVGATRAPAPRAYKSHNRGRVGVVRRLPARAQAVGRVDQYGYIIDGGTSQPLAGVSVWAMGTDRVTVTDSSGKWALDVDGSVEIYAYKPGYVLSRSLTKTVMAGYRWFMQPVWADINAARRNEFASGLYYSRLIFGMDISEPPFKLLLDGEPYDLPNPAWMSRNGGSAKFNYLPPDLQIVYPSSYAGNTIPADMIRPVINADHTATIKNPSGGSYEFAGANGSQTVARLVANGNFLLKVLACVCGSIQLACDPYPDCYNLQREYDNILNFRNINMAAARQTTTFAGQIVDGMGDVIAAIGKGFVKFIGTPVRTAFLQLLRLNVKGMATHLYANIAAGGDKSNDIKRKWEGFGGDFKSLLNASRDGSAKKALGTIGEPVTAAAMIAAATPIIVLLASYLKSSGNPELNGIVDTAIGGMNKLLTAAGYDPIAVGDAYGGKTVILPSGTGTITIPPGNSLSSGNGVISWAQNNPMLAAGAVAGVALVAMGAKRRVVRRRTK